MNLPRMPCAKACPKHLRRFHLTCIYCDDREVIMKQLHPKRYSTKPQSYTTIFLAVDKNRRYKVAKDILLQKWVSIAEVLIN